MIATNYYIISRCCAVAESCKCGIERQGRAAGITSHHPGIIETA
jgi:hypothetical protein